MTKLQLIAERVVVTIGEAAAAYGLALLSHAHGAELTTLVGTYGGGLSILYNVVRQAKPTIATGAAEQLIRDVLTPNAVAVPSVTTVSKSVATDVTTPTLPA